MLSFQHAGGTETGLIASASQVLDRFYNGTVDMPTGPEDVYINTYLYDWDLSAYSDITDFEIQWTGVQHAQLYALQLDQGSIYTSLNSDPTAVPEPSTMILLGSCALFGIPAEIRRRRKLNQAQNSPADSPQA